MELTEHITEAKVVRSGDETVVMTAGKRLKIETMPLGVEILSVIVPTGKQWSARIIVELTETNA